MVVNTITIIFLGISVTFGSILLYYSCMIFCCHDDDDEYDLVGVD